MNERITRPLSALDLAFFMLESRERMSNVGPLAVLVPPAGTKSPAAFANRLLRAMKKQPAGVPFNLRYRPPGLGGMPHLESVDGVDLDAHCHRHTLAAPGNDAQLFGFVCRLHEKRLARSKPLWELHVIDGLERGRIALYAKVHHGVVDGRGLVEIFRRWFATDPADKQVRALWNVLPPPKARTGRARAMPYAAALAGKLTDAGKSLLSLYGALARQTLASVGLSSGTPLPFLGTPAALRVAPSVMRSFAYCVLPLDELKAFGKAHEATVNDVLLTVLDEAMNRYLAERGHDTAGRPLVADMPVALGSGDGGGNSIAILQFPLGGQARSARERLQQVMKRTAELKDHVRRTDPTALVTYTAAVHGIPALLEALRVPKAPMLATAVISNPFGLPERRYLAGAELEMALPVSVLAPGQSLNITAATYDKGLQIAFIGLAAELPDIHRLAELTVQAFAELTRPPRAAGKKRARRTASPMPPKETAP